jgi:hypothetical protein
MRTQDDIRKDLKRHFELIALGQLLMDATTSKCEGDKSVVKRLKAKGE